MFAFKAMFAAMALISTLTVRAAATPLVDIEERGNLTVRAESHRVNVSLPIHALSRLFATYLALHRSPSTAFLFALYSSCITTIPLIPLRAIPTDRC